MKEPSPLAVHPLGETPGHRRAQSRRSGIRRIEKLADLLEVGVVNGAVAETVAETRAKFTGEVIFELGRDWFSYPAFSSSPEMACEMSGPEEVLCVGMPAAPSVGTGHAIDGAVPGAKIFGPVKRLGLKNWQFEESKLGRVSKAGKRKSIEYAEPVGHVPGCSEVHSRGYMASESRAKDIVLSRRLVRLSRPVSNS